MDALITYMVQYHTKFWNLSMQSNTTNTSITYTDLKPGTKYDFDVRVVAGNLTSDSVTVNASTGKETTFCLFMKQIFGFVICMYCVSWLCNSNMSWKCVFWVFLQTDFLVFKMVFVCFQSLWRGHWSSQCCVPLKRHIIVTKLTLGKNCLRRWGNVQWLHQACCNFIVSDLLWNDTH